MTEKRLESWVIDNPILAHAVFPTCVVLGALTLMTGMIFLLIGCYISIHSRRKTCQMISILVLLR